MQKTEALNEEEIDAQSDVVMEIKDGCRKWNGLVRRGTRGGGGPCHFAFEDGDGRAVYDKGALGVVRCDMAIVELSLVGAANLPI